jgi:lactoylglutathione lyase
MGRAQELRFAFTVDDFDAAVSLFRDVLGLETLMDLEAQGGRGVILRVPSATLELFDVRHTDVVDEIEAGRPLGERVRIAVRVGDLEEAARAVAGAGAEALARPVDTPWGDRNQRFRTANGMQLTLFRQEGR